MSYSSSRSAGFSGRLRFMATTTTMAACSAVAPSLVVLATLRHYRERKKRRRFLTVPPKRNHDNDDDDDDDDKDDDATKTSSEDDNGSPSQQHHHHYDVVIVGAGPAGSTLAYFLAKPLHPQAASRKLRVLLLERKTFPRPKYCGDAWCAPALDILETMEWSSSSDEHGSTSTISVLAEMERQGVCRPVQRGGFVSPFGHECINDGQEDATYGSSSAVRTYAIKRVIADEYLARAAQRAGVELREESEVHVTQVKFHKPKKNGSSSSSSRSSGADGFWTVPIKGSAKYGTKPTVVTGRILVAADGATSYLARHLGLVQTDADATCSHRYVAGGTHAFCSDGVMLFNRAVLPGYSALFRHANDDLYLGTYILPGGKATSRSLAGFETELVQRHPAVRQAFAGKDCAQATWRSDPAMGENGRLKTAPIRCGGEARTHGPHLLVVGDAAGQTDPLTGEGIHTSMMAAQLAAQTIHEMFQRDNFSAAATRVYHERWREQFGHDFGWSAAGARLVCRFPILLDAVCSYGQSQGQEFLDEFGQIMTGVKPKVAFLNPALAVPISFYLVREVFLQYVLRREPLVPQDIGCDVVEKHSKKK